METTIKQDLMKSYKTNNHIGQTVHKMKLVGFLIKNGKASAKNKDLFFVA